MSISMVEGSVCLGAAAAMGRAQVHWQAGQGDKQGGGGDEGPRLGQRGPEGEAAGSTETGREPNASGAAPAASGLGGSGKRGSGVSPLGHKASEGPPEQVREQAGSVCEESGVTEFKAGEAGGESRADVTDVREEEMSREEVSANGEATGEVIRGIGEGGCGEKDRAGT